MNLLAARGGTGIAAIKKGNYPWQEGEGTAK